MSELHQSDSTIENERRQQIRVPLSHNVLNNVDVLAAHQGLPTARVIREGVVWFISQALDKDATLEEVPELPVQPKTNMWPGNGTTARIGLTNEEFATFEKAVEAQGVASDKLCIGAIPHYLVANGIWDLDLAEIRSRQTTDRHGFVVSR